LQPSHVGLALLGYGVPGFLLGPLNGRLADRWGRARLIPAGLFIGAAASAVFLVRFPVVLAPVVAIVLSLGYDMTQPLFGGIVTSIGGDRPGQAMGLNVFTLFVGFGLGSLAFGFLMQYGFEVAFGAFAAIELGIAIGALRLFRAELPLTVKARSPMTLS
jgi:predicted MFS family arabinose efflux permease